jgi:hypothetical protein
MLIIHPYTNTLQHQHERSRHKIILDVVAAAMAGWQLQLLELLPRTKQALARHGAVVGQRMLLVVTLINIHDGVHILLQHYEFDSE